MTEDKKVLSEAGCMLANTFADFKGGWETIVYIFFNVFRLSGWPEK